MIEGTDKMQGGHESEKGRTTARNKTKQPMGWDTLRITSTLTNFVQYFFLIF